MVNSMTGFGRARASSNGISVQVECKSVNNRYLDLTLHLPDALEKKELKLKEFIQTKVNRGSLNMQVTIDKKGSGEPKFEVNEYLAERYKALLEEVRRAAKIETPVTLQDIIQFDAIFMNREEDEETVDLLWNITQQAADQALDDLNKMRRQEGEQLKKDLLERIDHIEAAMNEIKEFTENRSEQLRDQLLDKIQDLIDNDKIDEDRLEMEVAILAEKTDITEEVVRLESHIKFFREAVETEDAAGRRLKFLCQEMHREVNTMGSKANDSQISQLTVKAKENLEQIREQIRNIE